MNVDLEESVANLNAITLPETFADFELSLPDIDLEALPEAEDGLMDLNQIRQRELITIRPELEGRGRPFVEEELLIPASQEDLAEWDRVCGT